MLSWCSVREIKAHEVVLQDNDQSSRALEATPRKRSARKGCVCGGGAPAVRPQHVEVRVEERKHVEVCVEEKQEIHDVRKTRIHDYSQPAGTRGTVNDAVKASSRPWSTRHGPQSCILRSDRRKILTRAAVKDVTLQDATESTKDRVKRKTTRRLRRTRSGSAPRKHRETAHSRQGQRARCQEGEGGRRCERR